MDYNRYYIDRYSNTLALRFIEDGLIKISVVKIVDNDLHPDNYPESKINTMTFKSEKSAAQFLQDFKEFDPEVVQALSEEYALDFGGSE